VPSIDDATRAVLVVRHVWPETSDGGVGRPAALMGNTRIPQVSATPISIITFGLRSDVSKTAMSAPIIWRAISLNRCSPYPALRESKASETSSCPGLWLNSAIASSNPSLMFVLICSVSKHSDSHWWPKTTVTSPRLDLWPSTNSQS
jgi:hypothetical protein